MWRPYAGFKIPLSVIFVDALPYHTAANGSKLKRTLLRQWASEPMGRGGAS